jgi:hypothetical protein
MPPAQENASLQKSASRLNNLLQVLARTSTALEQICGENAEARRHLNALSTGLAGAKLVVADLLAQCEAQPTAAAPASSPVPATTLSETPPAAQSAEAQPVPPPAPAPVAPPPDISSIIENPDGEKELVIIIDD